MGIKRVSLVSLSILGALSISLATEEDSIKSHLILSGSQFQEGYYLKQDFKEYRMDGDTIYFDEKPMAIEASKQFRPISVIVPESQINTPFNLGTCQYMTDGKSLYLEGETIDFSVDIESFGCLGVYANNDAQLLYQHYHNIIDPVFHPAQYSKDEAQAYYYQTAINGADPESFQLLMPNILDYAKDKNQLYFQGEVIENADRDSFVLISKMLDEIEDFTVVDNNVIIQNQLLYPYAKDKDHVYFRGKVLEGVSPVNFVVQTIHSVKEIGQNDSSMINLAIDVESSTLYANGKPFKNQKPIDSNDVFDQEIMEESLE